MNVPARQLTIPGDRSDEAALHAFEQCILPAAQFTHRMHLWTGWQYLQRYGFPEGVVRFRERLLAYVASLGATGKYHESLTWAYMILMNEERVLRSPPGESFEAMIERRPDLLDHRNGAMARCYSAEERDSPQARKVLMLPRKVPATS